MAEIIVVAGATGRLGGRIAACLCERGAQVRALVRAGTAAEKIEKLTAIGVEIAAHDPSDVDQVSRACAGAGCVVSALAGLREVIVDLQAVILEAAVRASVPRFIPSDFASDYMKLPKGWNRNFDLRGEFRERLDAATIRPTSILNGAFGNMLFTHMPFVDFTSKRVSYWENADQEMDFTTIADVGAFTADAALDPTTPRVLRIAGDQVSARDLQALVGEMTGEAFELVRQGSLDELAAIIERVRAADAGPPSLYPKWQEMQYMRGMSSGLGKLAPLDNDRYSVRKWTTARDLLAQRLGGAARSAT